MTAAQLIGKGISFPPRVGADGRIAWSDGEENVRECIRIILLTNLNERIRLGEFGGGLSTFLFEPNHVATRKRIEDRIIDVLRRWEPRIQVESVRVSADPADPEAAVATIEYQLIATQARERVSLSMPLGN